MSKDWVCFLFTCAIVGGALLGSELTERRAYMRGQIDALNGKWKYGRVIKSDTTYKEIK